MKPFTRGKAAADRKPAFEAGFRDKVPAANERLGA